MGCPICAYSMKSVFTARVLGKYLADFEFCDFCGFLRIAEPHWLEEAYSSAIAATDTGLVMRNISIAQKLAAFLYFVLPGNCEGHYLDEAGGYGMMTRLMRDYGFDFYWSDKYCSNLFARGFEFQPDKVPYTAVTAFETMEHLINPSEFVQKVMESAQSDTFIFTTELFDGVPPHLDQWAYYSLQTGQHISFFQKRTLEILSKQLGTRYYYCTGFHIFTKKNISNIKIKMFSKKMISLMTMILSKKLTTKRIIDHDSMVSHLASQTIKDISQ